ncbi:hypothetical protein [Fusibacter bizertensis]
MKIERIEHDPIEHDPIEQESLVIDSAGSVTTGCDLKKPLYQ